MAGATSRRQALVLTYNTESNAEQRALAELW